MSAVATPPRGGTDRSTVGAHRSPEPASRRVLVPALIIFVGIAVILYPVVSSLWNNWLQQRAVSNYQEEAQALAAEDPEAVSAAIESARRYNDENRDGPILDPWLSRISEDNLEYQAYLHELSGLSAMSNIAIPSINSNLPVYHGTTERTLQKGIGHLFGSALPVGGVGNHTVLTGHTGLANATLWDNLTDVKLGDPIYISTFGEQLKYEVHDIEVVLPNETDNLKSVAGEDLLTLITCTPYGINSHRLLIHAHRVPMDPSEGSELGKTGLTLQWWMWLVIAVVILALAGLALWIRSQYRKVPADDA